jgi:UDP-3-O-acyl N-acetylglucosamine deacetylase
VATGVVFVRTDLGPRARIQARIENVTDTRRRTTLGKPPLSVTLVEHVLAALAGLHIDNCVVEVNAPEPPGLDGSALGFMQVLRNAGTRLQASRRAIWCPTESIVVSGPGATLALHPCTTPELRISYLLNYGTFSPIALQRHTETISPETFAGSISRCRTFLLEEEALQFRSQGLGSRTDFADLLVFGNRGPICNALRFADEPARHKILDLIGDLSLLQQDIHGHVVAYRSGHPLNVELVRSIKARLEPMPMRLAA